ncbi:hypothetical protein FRC07_002057 [Ceratobasidium sp. 392]|nr:hypothetical protein FRC07_002057 [Ceratobasidium sp. 392]
MEAYQYLMSLIPQVVWLGMTIEQRYDQVTEIAEIPLEAAIIAIASQAYSQALEWLEQGRLIVWTQMLELRSPLDELTALNAPLAEKMIRVANELRNATALKPYADDLTHDRDFKEGVAQRRRRLAEEWEQLVYKAQKLPNSSHFLAPKTASQLTMAAQNTAIVVVIVSRDCIGALLVRAQDTEITWTELKTASYDRILQAREQIMRHPGNVARAGRKPIWEIESDNGYDSILDMLWTDIAKPILDFLGYTKPFPVGELPHITWCTTGPLSFLPLHAAGDYTRPHCSLFDYCVSSYTPSLNALLLPPPDPQTFSGIALVSQASTPGLPHIPGTIRELDKITEQVQCINNKTRLDGELATCNSVIDAMKQHSWMHLACHASQNTTSPIASAFHLHDGPLDLSTISGNTLKHVELAFLSACQTATGDEKLPEEAIHLAAGMIMAGYRTVIATMWPIRDEDAPLVAEKFYEYMVKEGIPDGRKAARALHYAVSFLRQKVGLEAYKQWAPFIHIGV